MRMLQRLADSVGDRAAGAIEAPARPVGPPGPDAAAAGPPWPAAAEIPAGRGAQAGPRGVFRRLRGRCHVPPCPLGDGPRAASKTAATCSCRGGKAAAARFICTTATRSARRLADANLVAFELDRYDAILVNHGGCGAMLKEYGHHWHDGLQPHRARFADKVKDVHEFLDNLGVVPFSGRIEASATYHDSCHLAHAQRVAAAPRRLLAKIPGLDLRELPEAGVCCGAAGTYNLTEPEMSDRLSRRKLENILSTGAQIVLAANAGCLLQIEREVRQAGLGLQVMHPMELMDLSYRGEKIELKAGRP